MRGGVPTSGDPCVRAEMKYDCHLHTFSTDRLCFKYSEDKLCKLHWKRLMDQEYDWSKCKNWGLYLQGFPSGENAP